MASSSNEPIQDVAYDDPCHPLPLIDFDAASAAWRGNKYNDGSSVGMRYYRSVGDDVFVTLGTRWRRGEVTRVFQTSVDVKTASGMIRGVVDDRVNVQCWASTEFVESGDGTYNHRPTRRKQSRRMLWGMQVTTEFRYPRPF